MPHALKPVIPRLVCYNGCTEDKPKTEVGAKIEGWFEDVTVNAFEQLVHWRRHHKFENVVNEGDVQSLPTPTFYLGIYCHQCSRVVEAHLLPRHIDEIHHRNPATTDTADDDSPSTYCFIDRHVARIKELAVETEVVFEKSNDVDFLDSLPRSTMMADMYTMLKDIQYPGKLQQQFFIHTS